MALESPVRSATGSGPLGDSSVHPVDRDSTHTVSRYPPAPCRCPVSLSRYSQLPGPPPVSSFPFHLHPFSSPPLPTIPAPTPASVIKEPDWSGCHAASFPTIWAQKPNRQLSD